MTHHSRTAWRWRSRRDPLRGAPTGIALLVFLGIATFFLVTEHWAHIVPVLPWLFLLACPLMHLFMHSGHGGHGSSHNKDSEGGQR